MAEIDRQNSCTSCSRSVAPSAIDRGNAVVDELMIIKKAGGNTLEINELRERIQAALKSAANNANVPHVFGFEE